MMARALIFIVPLAMLHLASSSKPIDPVWRTDYAAACREADLAGKPLMLVFR